MKKHLARFWNNLYFILNYILISYILDFFCIIIYKRESIFFLEWKNKISSLFYRCITWLNVTFSNRHHLVWQHLALSVNRDCTSRMPYKSTLYHITQKSYEYATSHAYAYAYVRMWMCIFVKRILARRATADEEGEGGWGSKRDKRAKGGGGRREIKGVRGTSEIICAAWQGIMSACLLNRLLPSCSSSVSTFSPSERGSVNIKYQCYKRC